MVSASKRECLAMHEESQTNANIGYVCATDFHAAAFFGVPEPNCANT